MLRGTKSRKGENTIQMCRRVNVGTSAYFILKNMLCNIKHTFFLQKRKKYSIFAAVFNRKTNLHNVINRN